MKERPILFSAPMVKALLSGQKTQTRRPVKLPVIDRNSTGCELAGCELNALLRDGRYDLCGFGAPGDRLWVRENFQPLWVNKTSGDYKTGEGYKVSYPATDGIQAFINHDDELSDRVWPSIHMPRWASRITLEITEVRCDRLNDISEEDARAEGVEASRNVEMKDGAPCYSIPFRILWEQINGTGSWARNPFVWALSFRRI